MNAAEKLTEVKNALESVLAEWPFSTLQIRELVEHALDDYPDRDAIDAGFTAVQQVLDIAKTSTKHVYVDPEGESFSEYEITVPYPTMLALQRFVHP